MKLVMILFLSLFAVNAQAENLTSLTITSTPGDIIGQGASYTRTPADGNFMFQRDFNNQNGVSLFYHNLDYSEWWQIDFCGPNNATLVPGVYTDIKRMNGPLNGHPGFQAWTNNRGCVNDVSGSFTIKQVEYNGDGAIINFWATFVEHCDGSSESLSGEIRFQVDATSLRNTTWGRVKQLYR